MDPLSITSSVVALTLTCVQIAKALHGIEAKFQTTNLTISAICTETTIISASLSQLQSSILGNTEGLSNKLKERPGLEAVLGNALADCYVVFDALEEQIHKYTETSQFGSSDISFRGKIRYFWNENTMQEILTQMRGLQNALSLLLQLLGSQTMTELKQMMDNNTTVLSQIVQCTANFRVARDSSARKSIFNMSVTTQNLRDGDDGSLVTTHTFSFDNEIVNSRAYRRALAQAVARRNHDQTEGTEDKDEAYLAVQEQLAEQHSAGPGASQSPNESSGINLGLPENVGSNNIPSNNPRAVVRSLEEANLQGVPQSELQCQNALDNLIKSESQYLDQIKRSRYFQTLFVMEKSRNSPRIRVIDKVLVTDIWRSFEDIYYTNKLLLYDHLIKPQSRDGPWLSQVCDTIRNWIKQSGHSYVDFASHYPSAYHCVRTNFRAQYLFASSFHKFDGTHQRDTIMTENFLKGPLYRLQRYVLLLQEIRERSNGYDSRQNCGQQLEDLINDIKSLKERCDMALSQGQKGINMNLRSRLPADACGVLLPDSQIQFRIRTWFLRQRVFINYDDIDVIVLVIKTPAPSVLALQETQGGLLDVVEHLEGKIHADMVFKMSGKETQAEIKFSSHGLGDPIRLRVTGEETAKQLDTAVSAIGGVAESKWSVRTTKGEK